MTDQLYDREYAVAREQNPETYWEYRELFRLFRPRMDDAILDMGCNTGDLLYLLLLKGYANLTGIDINPHAIEIAKKKLPGVRLFAQDVNKISGDGHFNVVYSLHIIEHIENTDDFISAIKSRLNRGGTVVLSCPNRLAWLMKFEHMLKGKKFCYDPTHIHDFSLLDLKKILLRNGFVITGSSTLPLDLFAHRLLVNYSIRIPCGYWGGHNYIVGKLE